MTLVHVCQFSAGLDELTRREQRVPALVLRRLATMTRFSVFEASDNPVIARTMTLLCQEGFIRTDHSTPYPWVEFVLTDKGRELLAAHGEVKP